MTEGSGMFSEIVDLGHEIFSDMPSLGNPTTFWTYDRHARLSIASGGRLSMESRLMLISEHAGTHLDAPFHTFKDGETVGEIPLSRLVAPGHLLDLTSKASGESITRFDIQDAVERSGKPIEAGSAVLCWTGTDKLWGSPGFTVDRPHVPADTAEWICDQDPAIFGTDLIQVDDPEQWWYPTHTTFARANVPMVQQLCNLERLEGKKFVLVAVPLNIRDGTASPIRPVALIE